MARESVPRFDLYAELEVSPAASVAVIEAAYRSLAKRHHPDVAANGSAGAGDGDRIKRLNLAREWLTDADRRSRYDRAMGVVPAKPSAAKAESSGRSTRSRSGGRAGAKSGAATSAASSKRTATAADEPPANPADAEPGTFGLNSHRVRQFLDDLRALDEPRARQLRAGRFSVIHPEYPAARQRMLELGREHRKAESNLAREAAAVIVRGKVADARLAEEIAAVASDIAGAIALRDLLPREDFDLLLAPWTWRGGRIAAFSPPLAPRPASVAGANRAPRPATERTTPPASTRARTRSVSLPPWSSLLGAGLVAVAVIALGGAFAFGTLFPGASPDAGSQTPQSTLVADGETDAPSATPAAPTAESPTPTPGIEPATLRRLQRTAAQTIDALAAAAAAGDIATAKALTGGTAPGLRRSGLAEATFPDVVAADIAVVADGDGWLATVGDDSLRTADGATWTFDYGDRPLAVFGGTPAHDLFWLDPRHDLSLGVVDATVTRSEVVVRFEWSYPAIEAAFFDPTRVWLSSLTIGNRFVEVGPTVDVGLGPSGGAASLAIPGEFRGAASLVLVVAVTPPSRFTNQSTFELSAR